MQSVWKLEVFGELLVHCEWQALKIGALMAIFNPQDLLECGNLISQGCARDPRVLPIQNEKSAESLA